ncbi:hypothetical protein [Actinomadura rubrisoli]|uniref:Uncharacterized protein n=1 Tax=Actinomadura rubrisoli TaxID=2530368 RepID=A0A4R4ZM11_9ACTN|nr:hypothetical protein [Actinomadura rubrisoli]TDD59605.1 hypothetical protein E1298_46525 [Actinomadura rubrisoli]
MPEFAAIPAACFKPSDGTLARYMPQAGQPETDTDRARSGRPLEYASCTWQEPLSAPKGKTLTSRWLRVAVRLHAGAAGITEAKDTYGAAWRSSSAGTESSSFGSIHQEAPEVVPGIGDEAFVRHITAKTSLGESGRMSITVRLKNTVVTVEFQGARYPLDRDGVIQRSKAIPLDKPTMREAVMAFGRDVSSSLAACKPCRRR